LCAYSVPTRQARLYSVPFWGFEFNEEESN
jgi:hypothetical protein